MIILFDLDSTLSTIEGFDEIGRKKGVYEEVVAATQKTMDGDIPFAEAFANKLQILKPSQKDVLWLVDLYKKSVEKNAYETVKKLSDMKDIKVGILSNNLDIAVKEFGKFLSLSEDLCIGVKAAFDDQGEYLGLDEEDPLAYDGGKGKIIEKIKKQTSEKIIFIGDSKADMDAGVFSDLFIGYGGVIERDKVVRNAPHFAHNMNEVLKIISKIFLK